MTTMQPAVAGRLVRRKGGVRHVVCGAYFAALGQLCNISLGDVVAVGERWIMRHERGYRGQGENVFHINRAPHFKTRYGPKGGPTPLLPTVIVCPGCARHNQVDPVEAE